MQFPSIRNLALLALSASQHVVPAQADAAPASTYVGYSHTAAQLLIDKYYDKTKGLFEGMWWNTAAAMTQMADLQAYWPNTTTPTVPDLLATTFKAAGGAKFINGFYDDEGWWALTWIAAYDLTKQPEYLDMAESIWTNMQGGWNNGSTAACGGGGLWWNKKESVEASIENQLFMSVSAHLANRVPDKKDQYEFWFLATWYWFAQSGMLNVTGGIVQDGYDFKTCKAKSSQLSYTQGVVIGALLEMDRLAPQPEYLGNATAIADAVIVSKRFNDDKGIFTEPVGGFSNDTMQFKGIFMRNLRLLQRRAPKQAYVDFATKNADSIWQYRWAGGLIGPSWDNNTGVTPPAASSHSSGVGGLMTAAAMLLDKDTPDVVTKRSSRFWSKR